MGCMVLGIYFTWPLFLWRVTGLKCAHAASDSVQTGKTRKSQEGVMEELSPHAYGVHNSLLIGKALETCRSAMQIQVCTAP